jgi:hypothetical protein
LSFWPSSTLLLISSLGSAVLAGLLEVCELSDTELSDGERKLALRRCWACGWGDNAGDRFLPLPSTRPPPRDRREAMSRMSKGCTALVFVQAWWYATSVPSASERGRGGAGISPQGCPPTCMTRSVACKFQALRKDGLSVSQFPHCHPWPTSGCSAREDCIGPIDKSSGWRCPLMWRASRVTPDESIDIDFSAPMFSCPLTPHSP